jgi:lipopolysaccharide/colanic/teichoic acid biosynthesis glycosyltransferase
VNGYHGPTHDYESIIIRYYWDAMYVRKAGVMLDIKILAGTVVHGISLLAHSILSIFLTRARQNITKDA